LGALDLNVHGRAVNVAELGMQVEKSEGEKVEEMEEN
jgi:hypothetical protein